MSDAAQGKRAGAGDSPARREPWFADSEKPLADADICPGCGAQLKYEVEGHIYSRVIGVEYAYGHVARYDGVSEWRCPDCGRREGRWSGRVLTDDDFEQRWGGSDIYVGDWPEDADDYQQWLASHGAE